jgi:hypothetical protein
MKAKDKCPIDAKLFQCPSHFNTFCTSTICLVGSLANLYLSGIEPKLFKRILQSRYFLVDERLLGTPRT